MKDFNAEEQRSREEGARLASTRRVRLGDVAVVSAGQGAPQGADSYGSDGIPFVKAGHLQELVSGGLEDSLQRVNDDVARQHKLKLYTAGSLVFAKSGMSCMKGFVHTLRRDCYVVSHLAIVTPTERDSARFLEHYFKFHKPNELVKDAAYPSISLTDIANLEIEFPPLPTQRRIAAVLDKICELKRNAEMRLQKLQLLAQSRFVEMFGDPVNNERNWVVDKLLKLTSKIGSGATPKGGKSSYVNEGDSFIRSMNVYDARFQYDDLAHLTEVQSAELSNVEVCEGDVLLNITGASVARSCIVPHDVLPARVNQHVAIIRPRSESLQPVYLNALLISSSYKRLLLNIGETNGATRQAITKGQLEKLLIPLPPLSLQRSFAAFVAQLDKLECRVRKSIEWCDTLYRAKLQEYFG